MPHSARTKTLAAASLAWLFPAILLFSAFPLLAHAVSIGDSCGRASGCAIDANSSYVCAQPDSNQPLQCMSCAASGNSCSYGYTCETGSGICKKTSAAAASDLGPAPTPSSLGPTANPTSGGPNGSPSSLGPASGGKQYLQNPLKNVNSLEDLLGVILSAVVQLGSIILVMALVWVGAQFVFARGNEEQLKSARASLTWTVIGGVVLLGAQAIAMVIKSTAGALQ